MKRGMITLAVLPLLALAVQGLAFGLLWLVSEAAYGAERSLADGLERPLGWLVLGLAGVAAGAVAAVGLYRLFRDFRGWVAVPFTIVTYLPILVVASLSTYCLLVFWTVV